MADIHIFPSSSRETIVFSSLEDLAELINYKARTIDSTVRVKTSGLNCKKATTDRPGYSDYFLDLVIDGSQDLVCSTVHPFLEVTLCPDKNHKELVPNDPKLVSFLLYSKIVAQAELLEKLTGIKPQFRILRDYPTRSLKYVNLEEISKVKEQQEVIGYRPHPTERDFILFTDTLRPYSEIGGFSGYNEDPVLVSLANLRRASK